MDTKQINYAVIRGLRNDIPAEVTKLQKAGWITAGGVHVTIDGVGAAQAMVLPAPEKKVTMCWLLKTALTVWKNLSTPCFIKVGRCMADLLRRLMSDRCTV
jgi:hypothetical protein